MKRRPKYGNLIESKMITEVAFWRDDTMKRLGFTEKDLEETYPILEAIPKSVTDKVDAHEQGKMVIGGRRMGRSLSMRIATAKPVTKPKP